MTNGRSSTEGLFSAPKEIFSNLFLSWLKSLGGVSAEMADDGRTGGGDGGLSVLEVPNPDCRSKFLRAASGEIRGMGDR